MDERTRDIGGSRPDRGNRRVSYRQLLKGYHAIIFTVQDYPDPAIPNLRTPANDGRNLANLLVSHCGFPAENVALCCESETTWDGLDDRLRSFISSLSHDDSLLIYFAGHGEADSATRESYWLPHDAQKNNRRTWYSHDRLHNTIAELKARHVAVVSDSCFSGRLLRSAAEFETGTDSKSWLTDSVRRRSRTVLTSGGDHPVSDEGAAGLSIFNLKFTEFIRTTSARAFTLGQLAHSIQPEINNQTVCFGPLRDEAHDNGQFVLFRTIESSPASEAREAVKSRVNIQTTMEGKSDASARSDTPSKSKVLTLRIIFPIVFAISLSVSFAAFVYFSLFVPPALVEKQVLSIEQPREKTELNTALTFMQWSIRELETNIKDYTAIVTSTINVEGKEETEVSSWKVRHQHNTAFGEVPEAIYIKWLSPKKKNGLETVWIEKSNDNKLAFHFLGLSNIATLQIEPDRYREMQNLKLPVTESVLKHLAQRANSVCIRAEQVDDCDVSIEKGILIDDSECTQFQLKHHDKTENSPFSVESIFFSDELRIPVAYEAFSWPKNHDEKPALAERYIFSEIKLNIGLSNTEFSPKNPEYDFPQQGADKFRLSNEAQSQVKDQK